MNSTSTMAAQAGASSSRQPAGQAAFGAEDFIPFSFDMEDEPMQSPPATTNENEGQRKGKRSERKDQPAQSDKQAGKKRKMDERNDDGLSKKERIKAMARQTPWSQEVDWERCKNPAEMLHREIIAFDQWLSPTTEEYETRLMVIELIRKAICQQWRDAEVLSFGSQDTGLYLPQGDIDLVVVSSTIDYQRRESVLRSMAACLRRNNLATDVQVIAKAKVPIIKFVCTHGKYRVDVSVNQSNGVAAATYVNDWLRRVPAIRPLVMVTKHLLSQRGMSEVFSGGLGSYSVICMVISFLQLHPKVQRHEIDPARNLGVLFLEFLELYGKNYGYDVCGISIRGYGGYFSKARRGWVDDRKPFLLSIEDPQDPTNDISKGSFGIINVRHAISGAYDILTAALCQRANEMQRARGRQRRTDPDAEAREALLNGASSASMNGAAGEEKDPQSLLGTVLGVSRDVVTQRRIVSDLYHSGTLQYKLGRPSAPSSPRPAVPISAKDAHISDPSKAALSVAGSSRKTNNQQPETRRAKGRDQPAYSRESGVVDLTQNSSDHSGSRRDRHSSVEIVDEDELAASQGFSFSHSRGSDPNDEDEADSRYRASAKRPRLNGDDKFAPPKTYVVEDSDSDSGISTTFPTAQSGASNRTLAERRRPKKPSKSKKVASKDKSAYWSSKSTVSTPGNDSPEDGFIALAV